MFLSSRTGLNSPAIICPTKTYTMFAEPIQGLITMCSNLNILCKFNTYFQKNDNSDLVLERASHKHLKARGSLFILGNFIFIIYFRRKCTCMELFFGEGSKSKDEQDPLIEDDDKLSNLIEEGKPVLSLVPLRRQNGKRVWYGIVLGGFR